MRRHPIRLVLAVLATSFLAACADVTAPQAPRAPRFDATGTGTDTTTAKPSSHQGTSV